jgi:hypothetical protein
MDGNQFNLLLQLLEMYQDDVYARKRRVMESETKNKLQRNALEYLQTRADYARHIIIDIQSEMNPDN